MVRETRRRGGFINVCQLKNRAYKSVGGKDHADVLLRGIGMLAAASRRVGVHLGSSE